MGTSKYASPLARLAKEPIFKAEDARKQGIPSRMLSYYCKKGILERVGRGLYRATDSDAGIVDFEELVLTVTSIPHGIICLISALCIYELTDQIMREYWIAVPNSDKSPKRPHARIVRMRNITLGQTTILVGKCSVKIFDKERTIVDSFRYLSKEIAIKALQAYLKRSPTHKPDLAKLSRYAKTLKVNLTPYILALTT